MREGAGATLGAETPAGAGGRGIKKNLTHFQQELNRYFVTSYEVQFFTAR